MRQVFLENKRPRTSELPATSSPEREVLGPTDFSEMVPGVSSEISNAAVESVNRNRMLDFGKTTCKRIHPEPVIERERSDSSEEHHAGLLVGTWYYLIPDPSGALVSEVVDRKDLAPERARTPVTSLHPDWTHQRTHQRIRLCDGRQCVSGSQQ